MKNAIGLQEMHRAAIAFTVVTVALATLLLGPGSSRAGAAPAGQKVFASPDAAIQALVAAVQRNDVSAMLALLGPDGKQIITSGDPVEDRSHRKEFIRKVGEKCNIVVVKGTWAAIKIGKENWLFPIPLVKKGSAWAFDTATGKKEILARRIGEHELSTIDLCHVFVDAQREYFAKDRTGHGKEYAQKFHSTPGKKDGLYWAVGKGEPRSPLGPLAAKAASQGYKKQDKPAPFHGYYFSILTGQGANAPGGAKSYLAKGRMTGGYAMVAWPAVYRATGVKTFMVDATGIVYEKDLGVNTPALARAMTVFNPDDSWQPVRATR